MSGGGMLPVGGYATVTALKAGLAIPVPYPIVFASASLSATPTWLIGSSATATVGVPIPVPATISRISACGHCSAQVGTPTVSLTAWKTNQTSGSEIMTATSAATATGVGLGPFTSNTVLNAGKQTFAAADVLLISAFTTATSAVIQFLNVCVWLTPL